MSSRWGRARGPGARDCPGAVVEEPLELDEGSVRVGETQHPGGDDAIAFREVLTRLPDLELAADDLPRRPSNFITGVEAMPVRFTPTPRSP